MSHTPKPWFPDGMGNLGPHAIAITAGKQIDGPEFQREELIAEVYGEADDPNVKLITAAPDMLEALEDVWNAGVFECCCGAPGGACDGTCTYTRVKLAIKKARGK